MQRIYSLIHLLIGILSFLFLYTNCQSDDEVGGGNSGVLATISSLQATDIGDAGNGSDLQIAFTKIADESFVWAYRIFVVPASESAAFDLAKSELVPDGNTFKVDKTGSNLMVNLNADSREIGGQLIRNDVPYNIFVASITDDGSKFTSALSQSSATITLKDEGTNLTTVEMVTVLKVADVGNSGDGSDLEISFNKVDNENIIDGYRLLVVESAESADFDLAMAEGVAMENFTWIEKTGANFSEALPAQARTVSGDLLMNEVSYRVFVLTIAADAALHTNALSAASAEITLSAEEKVLVTYIANDGIMIEFGGKKVVIDAINRVSNLGGWIAPSNSAMMALENGDPPYDDIDVIMITHAHGDHYATSAVSNYLANHPDTKLILPASMKPAFAAYAAQIPEFELPKYQRISLIENEVNIEVLHVEHFDQFGYDFSGLESYAYIVKFGDKAFFHAGDLDYVDAQLNVFNILDDEVTAAFIPTFGNLVNSLNSDAILDYINPDNIVCLHFLTSTLSTTINQVNITYPDAIIFETPFETVEF